MMNNESYRSPFAHSNHKFVKQKPRNPIPLSHLSPEEVQALNLVNRCHAITPAILSCQLNRLGISTPGRTTRQLLDKLFLSKHLTKYTLDEDGKICVYMLGSRGKELLSSPHKELSTLQCKKVLAALQFVSLHDAHPDNIQIRPLITEAEAERPGYSRNHAFRPEALLQTQDHTIFVFAVRSDAAALEDLTETLTEAEKALFFSVRKLNISTKDSRVVLVCESADHQKAVEAELMNQKCAYAFPVFLTNDEDTYNGEKKLCPYPLEKGAVQCAAERIAAIFEAAF